MSRSRRKTPICPVTCAQSEKKDKRRANQLLRRRVKDALQRGDEVLPILREVSDVWSMAKDGKSYREDAGKELRK